MEGWADEESAERVRAVQEERLFQFIRDEYDNALISYNGKDYMFDLVISKKDGHRSWYLMDVLEFMTERKPRPLAGPFDSLDSLLMAPLLDGKSIDERYSEIETSDTFRVVEE